MAPHLLKHDFSEALVPHRVRCLGVVLTLVIRKR